MKKLLSYSIFLLMSLFLIGCGDDDNSNDKPKDPKDEYKIGVTAQYLYSLIGTSYDQLKSSDIGEVKEESAIKFNNDDNTHNGYGVYTNLTVEGINMSAKFILYKDKLGQIDLHAQYASNEPGIEAFKSISTNAVSYWGNPIIELEPYNVAKNIEGITLEEFWKSQYNDKMLRLIFLLHRPHNV